MDPDFNYVVLAAVSMDFQAPKGSTVRVCRATPDKLALNPKKLGDTVEVTASTRFVTKAEKADWPSRYAKYAV